MNNNHNDRLQIVQSVLELFFNNFQEKSLDYLYEEDIRAEIFSLLKESLSNDLLLNNISRVKNEYHFSPVRKIDISILADYVNINPTSNPKEQVFHLYKQKVEIGIEIKLQSVYRDQFGAFAKDIEKLKLLISSKEKMECIETGIAFLFFQLQSDFDKVKNLFSDLSESGFQLKNNCVNKIVISPANIIFGSAM